MLTSQTSRSEVASIEINLGSQRVTGKSTSFLLWSIRTTQSFHW